MAAMAVIATIALAVAGFGFWLFKQDQANLNFEKQLRGERSVLNAKIAEAEERIPPIAAEILPEQDKVAQSEESIRQLEDLQSTWDRLVGNRAQQRANAERLEKMRATHATAISRVAELQQQVARAKWERDNDESERTRIDSQLRVAESHSAGADYQVRRI